ncbi:MAG: hypothetical protein J0L60_13085 [Ignavibacteria bacterium]|nr:hypothetical protein [Ignavibacteria bacterium]
MNNRLFMSYYELNQGDVYKQQVSRTRTAVWFSTGCGRYITIDYML